MLSKTFWLDFYSASVLRNSQSKGFLPLPKLVKFYLNNWRKMVKLFLFTSAVLNLLLAPLSSKGLCCLRIILTTRQTRDNRLDKISEKLKFYFWSNKNVVATYSEFEDPESDWDPSRTCPGGQQEWQIYWKIIGLEVDSTVSLTCQQKAELRSVIFRPRTTNTKNTISTKETARKYLPTISNTTVTKTNTHNKITQQTIGLHLKEC